MDTARKIEVLDKQVTDAQNGNPADFQGWHAATEVALRTVMGADSPLLERFQEVRYRPSMYTSGTDFTPYIRSGVRAVIAILEAAKSELMLRDELDQVVETDAPAEEAGAASQSRVFIVHGHNDHRKHELARALRAATGVEPIILHEQPNGGRTIIEKLEEFGGGAGFAVALLTGDDLGRVKDSEEELPRARQNVVYEAGYFGGLLGRSRVVLLHEEGVEIPGDLSGVLFEPLDAAGGWKMKVAHEMSNAGITIDWAALAAQ